MAKKKKESLSRTLAEVSKGVTKTVANDKSVSAKVRKQAKSDYRKASRISNSSASKNYISNSRLRRTGGSSGTSANSASMANRMRGESASQRNAGGNTIREIARSNTPKKNSVSRTYSELQNKTKDMNLTDTAVGRGMARAGLTAKGTAKEAYGGIKTAFSAIRDPNEERNIKADQLREQRGEQTKGNKYEGAYDKLRNAQRDNREQREKDLKSASKMLESASADKQKAKEGLGKAGKFALDVESALLGMAGDAAVGAVTGTGQVGALGSMFVRSFGGGYDLAKREGASDSQAALYAAVTGGKEVLTEKMFNVGKAFSGVFGKGLGDDVINKAAEKGAEKLAKKFGSEGAKNVILHGSNYLASALTEGLEEVASTASDPFIANAIYARAVGNPHSFDAGQTGYDFLIGAALGGLGGGIAEASNYSQGGQVKNVLGKDGLKEVADRVAYADEDSGISDSAKAISQMILNGEDVANAQALKLYKAAEAQEQKNFTQYRDAIKGATSIIERDNLISPSGLTVDESGQVIPSIGDNTNIKFQESRTEARKEAEKLQLKDDVAASIGDTIASIKTGIGVVDDIETIVRYPEAKAVYESVTGETLPSGRKALREYLYKKNAENRVQSAREETEFWKDQAVGLLSQTETEDFGGNGQAVFTKATENLDVNELGNSALTKVRTTINDYYNSAKLGIPFSTLNDIAKPEYDAVSEDIKREAYNAGILDSNDIYKYLDGIAVNKDESIKSSANKENRNANPGKLYVDADNAARKYFTNSQQKMWKALAEEFSVGIHIMDAESFADALRAKGQNEVADSESLPNGFYDNGEIYLNVETPDRATRYVFMHEFTHFLEQTAPKEYSELRKQMIDALIEDGSLERRLSRKRMQYGEGISQDDLIDEILADSTYEFLNDKDFANGIARESEKLAQAIINAIRNLIRKIRNVLARDEYTPTQNANMYAQLGVLKDMEALWLDAVNAARENARVGETTDSARFSLTDNNGNALSEGQQVYFKNSKVRDEDGNLMVMYHGTMNAGFTVFDKSKANVEGNSGAGFYFSNQKADSLENYSDHTGADNEIKIEFLAEQIMEMGEWNDVEIDTYEEARNIAIKELERNPGMYEVYINITKPYIRAFDNSTNIYTDIEDSVDDSLVEREDYDTEEEYFDDLYNSRNEQIYDKIDRAFYGALQEVESRYGEIEFSGQYADAIYGIYSEATDYGRLNFTDIYQALQGYSPSVYNDENGMQLDCTSELTRQFIEEFGYDGIIDKEVSHKFGKMNSMDGAIHAIAFNPEQAKLTINDKPTTNPDIRFSLKGKAKEEIENLGVAQTESGSVVRYSLKSWSDTDKAKLRKRLKEAGFKRREIDKWIEDVNGISEIIALDRERLDYTAAENQTMLKHNDDYYRSLDASTLCAKRILYQGTYNAIQKALPNTPLLVDDVVRIRQMLDENGLESPCGICYVESRRKTLGKYSSEWLESYKGEYIPTLADVTTTDGLEALRREHPKTYDDYMKAMRKKGVANPKVVELRTDYRGEIDKLQEPTIEKIIRIGGLRIQSFSDFETPHLIDMMQAVLDMAAKGLTAQAYTKVPNFAWAFGDTGIKINLSLIAKKDKDGNLVYDEDGRLMFDSKEGMPIEEALKLRERYPENVGTIVVGISEEHIKAAMADDRIDMIIPFHRSGWGKAEFEGLGLTGYEDFQAEQEEYLIHPYETGKMKNGKPEIQRKPVDGGFYSNDYWDFKKSGKENAEIYLKKCADTGRYPVFKSFLKDNGDGSFSLQEDGSTDGYWKMLIDFKMYDNNGKGVKQKEVTPNFNMAECRRILSEYEGGADTLPVADEVVDAFIKEYKEKNPDIKFSLLDNYTVDNNGELVHLDKGLSARPQRARYTEERIDDILEAYGSDSEKYAQAYITSMSPRTFLKLTLSDEKRSEWERAEKEGTRTDEIFPLDTEQLKNESQTPFLKIDSESGEVLSHEGRHRMLAMYNAGIRNVPVVVIDNKTKYSKTITPSMTLLSQDFGEGNVNYGYKVSVTNLIPTNKVYKDKIMEAYGNKAAIKFSKKESTDASLSEMENVETVPTDEEVYEYMASHPEIYKEMWSFDEADKNYIKHKQNTYAELETKVEQLKQNQKKTYGKVLDEKSVRPAMNELVKSILQASEQGRGVKKTDNKMVNDCVANAKKIFTAYKNGDTELMITTSLNAAESMVESLKFIDDSMYVYYKDLRDYLRNTPIRVSDTIKGDIADYSAWRKSKFGKIRISDVGIPVDDVYTELCEKFPEMFDRELSNPTDQLLRMGDAIEEIQPYVVYLSSEEYDNLIRQTAGDLIDITVKGRAYKSMADRYEDRISAVKQRAEEARKDAQKKKKEAIGKEREKADVRVAEEKDKRKQTVSKERERADARVTKEREKRKKADNRRKEAYKRRKSMKMLTEDYKWLSGRILKPTDDKHVPDRMVAPLAELLQYIDLETEYSKKFEKRTGKPTGVAVNLRNLKSALEDVSKSSEANWILEDEDLPQMIEELQKRIEGAAIYELDNSELDAVQALLHAIRVDVSNANKAFVASRSIDDTAKAVIWEANEYAANSKKRRSGGIVNQLLNESMVKPMEFFEHLGPTMKSVYMGLRRGMDVQSNRMKETRAFFAEVFEGYGKKGKPGSEIQKWRNEKTLQEFELESGEKISLNTAQIMSLYCLSKRVQAVGHIYGQGICASEIRDFGAIRSTIGDKDAHKKSTTMVERKDIMNIISKLTDEQIKMADKLQDYLNTTVAGWGNETSLLMYDRKKFTEENYFPIKTQDVYLDANFEKRQRNIESIKNFGFTKGTVVNANNPIVIDDIFAVVAKHVNQMILYNAYAPAISDFTRVYNYREVEGNQVESVQAILADTYGGKIIGQYISKFMSDLQSNTQTRRGGYEMVANILLANYKKAAIGASPRVALQQPTAIVRALSEIDAKYFVKMEHSPQLLQMATKKDNALKEMLEHCPIAYWKSMGFNQVDMARDIEDIMMNMEWSRLDVLTMSIYGALDNYTWSKIWKAIKAEQKDLHPEVEYESDEFWELCNERAIEVFDKTQVVDSVFHRSDVMRSDNLLIKSITSFMSEPTTTFNMLRSNLMRANDLRVQGKGKEAFKLTRRTLNVYIANAFACAMAAAIADAILKKQTGDDDDEENKSFIEFWLANTIVNFKNNVSPLNLMPITRDFSSFADGWGAKNMFEEGIALVIEDAVAIKNKATDPASTKKTWEELITELAKDSSYLTGIPVKNFMRYGAGILDFLGINAFAAEKDSEGGQSKSLFGEILEMAGFSNGDDSANSQSQSLEAQYEESWLTKKLHEAGITEGTRLDNVLNFFGLNKSIEEQKEEHYQDMLSAAKAAGKGYVGVERDEKIYSKATDGYTKLAEAGEFEELARIRRVLVELDVDTTNFDERVESHIKTGIKKQIGEKGDSKLRNRLLNQLKEVYGYTDEQISADVLAKTDTATAFQKALCEDNYDEAVKQLRYLRQAGLTYETFLNLYEKRWKVIDAKTTGTFSWPAQGRISSGFGQRWGTLHAGIDIAMPTGTEVVASDGGEVVYTGYNSAMGNYVDIKHSNGYVTRYQHLSSYGVLKGEKVKKGQYIASSGNTGNSTGPHLHFAVYRSTSHSGCSHSTAVDPSIFLKSN